MGYQDAEMILDSQGRAIPQWYDPVDKVYKPLTKDNYDPQVRTELEEIKQQQAEILDRLNQPIDTQLIGSNVEELIEENISVSAGSTMRVGIADLSGFNSFTISAKAESAHNNFKFSIRNYSHELSGHVDNSHTSIEDYASRGSNLSIGILSERISSLWSGVSIYIVNQSDSEQKYDWVRVSKYV